ncbi:MAG: hypothetical protein Kow0092_14860 [Deferrisomatales bacterium]
MGTPAAVTGSRGGSLRALRAEGRPPRKASPTPGPDVGETHAGATGGRLLCRVCATPITDLSQRLAPAGAFVHRKVNPAGVEFTFGCFRSARGAAVTGSPTWGHSWFVGYAWSFALCRGCAVHLGWFYEGSEPSFFGLILDRLVPEDPSAGDPS